MDRDFEKDYKEYASQDLPDLWSRIEPNLQERGQKKTQRKHFQIRTAAVSLLAAAASLTLVILVYRSVVLSPISGESSANTSEEFYEAASEAAYEESASDLLSTDMMAGQSAGKAQKFTESAKESTMIRVYDEVYITGYQLPAQEDSIYPDMEDPCRIEFSFREDGNVVQIYAYTSEKELKELLGDPLPNPEDLEKIEDVVYQIQLEENAEISDDSENRIEGRLTSIYKK